MMVHLDEFGAIKLDYGTQQVRVPSLACCLLTLKVHAFVTIFQPQFFRAGRLHSHAPLVAGPCLDNRVHDALKDVQGAAKTGRRKSTLIQRIDKRTQGLFGRQVENKTKSNH
jgi:hypothetical protein